MCLCYFFHFASLGVCFVSLWLFFNLLDDAVTSLWLDAFLCDHLYLCGCFVIVLCLFEVIYPLCLFVVVLHHFVTHFVSPSFCGFYPDPPDPSGPQASD